MGEADGMNERVGFMLWELTIKIFVAASPNPNPDSGFKSCATERYVGRKL
jgi:hypothetical protein